MLKRNDRTTDDLFHITELILVHSVTYMYVYIHMYKVLKLGRVGIFTQLIKAFRDFLLSKGSIGRTRELEKFKQSYRLNAFNESEIPLSSTVCIRLQIIYRCIPTPV